MHDSYRRHLRPRYFFWILNTLFHHHVVYIYSQSLKMLGLVRTLTFPFSTSDSLLFSYFNSVRYKQEYQNDITNTDGSKLELVELKLQLLAFSFQLLAFNFSFQLLAFSFSFQLLALLFSFSFYFWLLVFGFWLLAFGFWLLAFSFNFQL